MRLLFLRRWREQRRSFPRWTTVPTFSKKEQFPQVHGMIMCDALLPHSRSRSILPAVKRVQFGDAVLPHAPLASPNLGPREFCKDVSERAAFCTIQPYSPSLHHHRYVNCAVETACTASGGVAHAAQPVSLAHVHNSTRLCDSVHQATSQVQRRSRDFGAIPERPVLLEEIAVLLAKSLQPR